MIDLWRERAVYLYFFIAGCLTLRQCRVVEVWKSDSALDLQRAGPFEKNRRCVRIDAAYVRMRRRVHQKCEDPVLSIGIRRRRSCHAVDLRLEDCGTQDLS